jgi:Tfp pilus assembly protein PilO
MLVSALAALAVLAGFWFAVLAPKRTEAGRLDQEVATAQRELDDATRMSADAAAAQRSYSEDTAAVASLGKALPEDDQTASLLYQLDAAAGRSNVELKSISPGGAAPVAGALPAALPPGVTEMSLALSFEGRFADLQRFLARVQSSATVRGEQVRVHGRLLSVQGFQLNADGARPGRVQATVTASAYIASAVAAAPPAAAGAAPEAVAPSADTGAPAAPPTQAAMVGVSG